MPLCGTEGEIQSTVSDFGVGFDPADAIHRHGLGLIRMRERMQLVGGEFSIKSQPGSGNYDLRSRAFHRRNSDYGGVLKLGRLIASRFTGNEHLNALHRFAGRCGCLARLESAAQWVRRTRVSRL